MFNFFREDVVCNVLQYAAHWYILHILYTVKDKVLQIIKTLTAHNIATAAHTSSKQYLHVCM